MVSMIRATRSFGVLQKLLVPDRDIQGVQDFPARRNGLHAGQLQYGKIWSNRSFAMSAEKSSISSKYR